MQVNKKKEVKMSLAPEIQEEVKLKKLRPSHELAMICFLEGLNQIDTAKRTGMCKNTVSVLWNSPEFQSAWLELKNFRNALVISNTLKVRQTLNKTQQSAADTLASLLVDQETPPSVQYSVAKTVLEMTGHKPPDHISITDERPKEIVIKDEGYKKEDDPYYQAKKELGLEDSSDIEEKEILDKAEKEFDQLDINEKEGTKCPS